jgi:LysR family hydrogen peroxide-inducible transcriptional activator
MNIQQLEYIIALDRLRSFSKAAESCFITQATLSTMVRKLEEELGVVLFDRKVNPIVTTDCGREIIDEAKKVLLHIQDLKFLASQVQGKISGKLSIGIIPTISGSLVHRLLPVISEKYSNLQIELHEYTTSVIIEKLKSGELDAGILSSPLNDDSIEEEILYYEKLKVYGNVSKTKKKYVMPEHIKKERVWLLEEGNCLREQFIQLCSIHPANLHSNVKFHPNTFETLLHLVDYNGGLTLLPELYIQDMPETKRSLIREFKAPFPVREISMVFHRPYAKLRLTNMLANEIKLLIKPLLETSLLKNKEMLIAKN